MFTNKKRPEHCTSELLLSKKNNDYIVILHGLRRSLKHMKKISAALHKENYNILQISYPSTLYPLDELIKMVLEEIGKYISINDKKIKVHFVGHSLGGLIIRGLIKNNFIYNLGRIVMIGTPNQGNIFADYFTGYGIFEYLHGPVSEQLISDQKEFKHLFGEIRSELGIIAGNKVGNYYLGYLLQDANDGRVCVCDTILKGSKEHIIIHESHDELQTNPTVIQKTVNFIKNGKFK